MSDDSANVISQTCGFRANFVAFQSHFLLVLCIPAIF
jgi:hypothetical protein